MAFLTVTTGAQRGKVDDLAESMVVGRSPDCDIQYSDRTVSRNHAKITRENDEYYIVDLGSQHGTLINGRRIQKRERIPHGAMIDMGECRVMFEEGSSPPSPATAESSPGLEESSGTEIVDALEVMESQRLLSDQKLRAVLEIMHNVGVALEIETIFPKVLESMMTVFPNAQRACIKLTDSRGLVRVAAFHIRDQPPLPLKDSPEFPMSRTLVERVLRYKQAILSDDALNDDRLQSESFYKLELRSLMCTPLMSDDGAAVGLIYIDTQQTDAPFQGKDLDVLITIANLAARGLGMAQLHNAQLLFERQQQDLQLARDLQLHFLPAQSPNVEGYQLASFYQAALNVGGDYLGCLPLEDGRVALVVADVAGKGTSAALVMARMCSDVRYGLATHEHAADVVKWLSEQMLTVDEYGRFVTMALGILSPDTHEVEIANAGHPPPLLKTATGIKTWAREHSGPPLGVMHNAQYSQQVWEFEPGDCLLLHSDGANEVTSLDGVPFGLARVADTLAKGDDAVSVVANLQHNVESFLGDQPQPDDICILCVMREK